MNRSALSWFEIDKDGLAKILQKRGKSFALFELVANAWDTKARNVKVSLSPLANASKVQVIVEDDDPDGFKKITDAFTVFADSEKKKDATKRGRFNLGEKLVLALCEDAQIVTTTGTVSFDKEGRHTSRVKTEVGSIFDGVMRMTRAEYEEVLRDLRKLIVPEGIKTTVNGVELLPRKRLRGFEAVMPTEFSRADDPEQILHRTIRSTTIEVYEPGPDESEGMLYELGIPVVATGDRWHVNVMQKVPLNMDRDNVTPAFLTRLRTVVVNQMKDQLTVDEANTALVREAAASPDATPEAVQKIMDLRFGEKRVAHDPTDPEANSRAVAEGYTLVYGGMMDKAEWKNAKLHGLIRPAGQVTPTPKPYGEDGEQLKLLAPEKWTVQMHRVAQYARWLALELMGAKITVSIASEVTWKYGATYGPVGVNGGQLTFNLGRLGYMFFNDGLTERLDALLIHEFGHHYELNHLDEKYHDALCTLGAKLARLNRDDVWSVQSWFTIKDE